MKKLFLIFMLLCVTSACSTVVGTTTETLKVEGLCGMCKARIENTAKEIDGVTGAEWDGTTKMLTLEFDLAKTKLETISKAIAKAGHDTEKDRADDNVYNSFPDCCKYRI